MNTPAKSSASRSYLTKAQLEATVTELRAALAEAQRKEPAFTDLKDALEASHKKEVHLQQQIADLQSDLQQQKDFLNKLEKDLEKIDKLKIELEQAKKAAIQLAAANEKLNQEVNGLKKENETLKTQENSLPAQMPGRPIQKETEKPADFAKNSWLL
jgi:chromosome segregation ATPase